MENVPGPQAKQLARRRGDYGFDEPIWPLLLTLLGLIFIVLAIVSFKGAGAGLVGVICCLCALVCFWSAAIYLYTTRRGKFQVWAEILVRLGWQGDEQILDMGCGRGAVLLMAATLLPRGQATGIDLWKTFEQSGNALSITQHNAQREEVADRVVLRTADMQHLPFPDASFHGVLSSMAIHNVRPLQGRTQALGEAVRVLQPGGRLLIADLYSRRYEDDLSALGMVDITRRTLGWRFWYGGPWTAPALVSARKPL